MGHCAYSGSVREGLGALMHRVQRCSEVGPTWDRELTEVDVDCRSLLAASLPSSLTAADLELCTAGSTSAFVPG